MECNLGQIAREAFRSLIDPVILPYYGFNVLYGITENTNLAEDYGQITSVIFKTLPIWYLVFYVRVIKNRRMRFRVSGSSTSLAYSEDDEISYSKKLTAGLVFSLIGDALLVFPETFIPGAFVFGVAHVLYIFALKKRYGAAGYAWLVVPLCMITSPYIMSSMESYSMAGVVFLYNATLNTMLFFAISSLESRCCAATLLAAVGALSFTISDSILGFDMWIKAIPYRTVLVMSTYYFAQVCLSLSAL